MRALLWIAVAGCMDYNPEAGLFLAGPPLEEEVPEGWQVETFEGGELATVDVIVFGDTSGSMTEEMQTLGQTITPFVERLATYVEDWQLAAVTGGGDCTASGTLRPDTPDFAARFAEALVQPIGDDGQAEMGLRNVTNAIEASGPGDCNEGLVRGGMLQVVFVTDENEESPGYDESPDYWHEYVDRIAAVHGDVSKIKMSAVAGPTPDGCFGADPGFGYDGPVAATGGEYLSICGDWATEIDLIADTIAMRTTFALADVPVPETIRVWVNEQELDETGIFYDRPPNTVTITTPAGPEDEVTILYEPEA